MAANTIATNNITMIVEAITTTIIPEFLEGCLGKNKKALKSMCARLSECEKTKDAMIKIITDNLPKQEVKIIKEKKTKAPKDPDAPKRNKSSYLFFSDAHRDKLKKKFPDLNAKQVLKKLGAAWTEAKESKKTGDYEKMAEEDKKRYKEEVSNYVQSEEYKAVLLDFEQHPEKYAKKTRGKKKIVDSNKPKRPIGAFFTFCADNRDQAKEDNPEMTGKEISKVLALMWKNEIDSDTKKNYTTEANAKMADWKKKMGIYKPQSKTTTNQPKKAKTPYQLFCVEKREGVKDNNPDLSGKEVTKELSRMWKEDYKSDSKRQEWVEASASEKKEYINRLSSWVKKQSDAESSEDDDATQPEQPQESPESAKRDSFQLTEKQSVKTTKKAEKKTTKKAEKKTTKKAEKTTKKAEKKTTKKAEKKTLKPLQDPEPPTETWEDLVSDEESGVENDLDDLLREEELGSGSESDGELFAAVDDE